MTIALDGAYVDGNINYQQPTTGTTVTLRDQDARVILDPAGTLATLTVKFNPNPLNGQWGIVQTTRAITALTVSPNTGQSIGNGAPTTLAAGQMFTFVFRAANNTWYVAV